jgi:hypothetical protein
MPDDPISGMRQQIAVASGGYAVITFGLLAVAFGGKPVFETLVSLSTGSSSGAILFATLSAVSFALGYSIVTFDLHGVLDRHVFGARRAIDTAISHYIQKEVDRTLGSPKIIEQSELMGVFYEFANRSDGSWPILRSVALDGWTPYHISLNWFGLSVGGLVLSLVSIAVRGVADWYDLLPIVFFLLLIGLTLWLSQRQLRPTFESLALPELIKMTKDERANFDKIVKARFS